MNRLISLFIPILLSIQAFAQPTVPYTHGEVSSALYNSYIKVKYLERNAVVKRQLKKIIVPIDGKRPEVFITDPEWEEYAYFGDIKGTKLSLIQMLGPNEEKYYVVNRHTGTVDTLIGRPVFSDNMKDFACLNNPSTDEAQRIQMCEIRDGNVHTRGYIYASEYAFFDDITCIKKGSLLAKTSEKKYWRVEFTIKDN